MNRFENLPPSARATTKWRAVGLIAWTFLATGVIAVVFEFPAYGRLVGGSTDIRRPESYFLLWALAAKQLVIWFPFWLASMLAVWRRAIRLERVLSFSAAIVLATWLILDSRVFHATGNHVSDYLAQSNRQAWEFAGGTWWMVWFLARWVPLLALIIVGTLLALRKGATLLGRLKSKLVRRLPAAIAAALLLAAFSIRFVPTQGRLLQRVEDSLPIELSWIRIAGSISHSDSFCRAFERETERELFPPSGARFAVRPPDDTYQFKDPARRDIVLIVLESLRASALNPDWMPALAARAKNSLQFPRHSSGGNNSTAALFELLYGRSAASFNLTLNAHILPPVTTIFQRNGYDLSYVATLDDVHRLRGEEFLNHRSFPRLELSTEGAPTLGEMQWVERDRWSTQHVGEILTRPHDRPQFVLLFLGSTHYPYMYPPQFERFKPVLPEGGITDSPPRLPLVNRYANSVGFMDAEVESLIQSIDMNRTIVIVVGDHGEGLLDDGTIAHASRLSSAQTRVPMLMFGAGITPGLIDSVSVHADFLPTLLHVVAGAPAGLSGVSGVDLLDATYFPREEVLLVSNVHSMVSATAYRVGILRDEGRIALTVDWINRTVRVRGVLDETGRVTEGALPPESEANRWSRSLVRELRPLFE